MVGFRDGGMMAHLGPAGHAPCHRLCAALARAREHLPVERLDLAQLGQLTFEAPDDQRFPALRLAREVMARGGLSGAVFNAAKEIALDHFIAGRSGFWTWRRWSRTRWTRLSAETGLGNAATCLDDVLAMNHLARVRAAELAEKRIEGR